ncbi:DUF4244 domain-containing protein [Pseudonocardia sp. TRM90224]|uniref:DUF4244 domain-containing protein n=1 Tax=Pseudonocardia sp. TRM90224 TaxID=2812678 RepID=UPI001E2A5730|nr:DUF4244 domain-containing protein [Pseudonocardia sp. TRM90224]
MTRTSIVARMRHLRTDDTGMSTVEYAVGLLTAATVAAILYAVLNSGTVTTALTALVERALTVNF